MKCQPYVRLFYSHAEALPVPQTLVIPLLETPCGFVSHLVSAQAGGGLRGPEAQVWARADPSLPSDPFSLLISHSSCRHAVGPGTCLRSLSGALRPPRLPGCFLGLWPEPPSRCPASRPLSFSPPETVSSSLFCVPAPWNLSFWR